MWWVISEHKNSEIRQKIVLKSCFWTLLQKRFQKTRWKCWCESGCKIRTPCFGKKMEHNIRIKKAWSLKRMFNNTNKVIRKDYCILSHYSSNWILIRMMWLVSRWGTLLPPGTVCSMATVRNSRLPGESRRGRWVGDIWKCTSEWSRETFEKAGEKSNEGKSCDRLSQKSAIWSTDF